MVSIPKIYFKSTIYIISLLTVLILLKIIPFPQYNLINLFLTTGVILFLPGFSLFNIFFNKSKQKIHEKIVNYFIFSLILLLPLVLIAYFTKLDIDNLKYSILGLILFVSVIDITISLIKKESLSITTPQISQWKKIIKTNYPTIIVFILAGGFLLFSYKIGTYLGGDSRVHIAIIRKMIENGISAENPFFKDFGDLYAYAYSLWQPILAVISRLSGTDPVYTWSKIATFLTPLIPFAFYFSAKNIFKNKNIGLICTLVVSFFVLYISFISGGKIKDLSLFIYPSGIAIYLLLPIFFGWLFNFLNNKKRWVVLILITLISFVVITTHLFYFILILLSLASFLFFHFLIYRKNKYSQIKRIALVLIVILLVTLPYTVLRIKTSAIEQNVLDFHKQLSIERGAIINLGENLEIIKPNFLFNTGKTITTLFPLLGLLILTPILLIYFRKKTWAIFLISLILIPPIIYLNPLFVFILDKIIGAPKIASIYQITPIFYMLPLFIWLFINFTNKTLKQKRGAKLLLPTILMLIVVILTPWKTFSENVEDAKKEKNLVNKIFKSPKTIDFLQDLPKNSTISTNSGISTWIPMVSSNYVITISKKHGSCLVDPNVITKRMEDQQAILDPQVDIEKTKELLADYKVDYILINDRKNIKFKNQKDFKIIYKNNSSKIYKIIR